MNKKILLGIVAVSLALTPLANAGWKEWAAGLSFGSIVPALAYAYHTQNAPLALGYTLGASLTSLALLLWSDGQPTIDIEILDANDRDALELNALSAIDAISIGKKAKIIYSTYASEPSGKLVQISKTMTIKPIANLAKALDKDIRFVSLNFTFSHPIDTRYSIRNISKEVYLGDSTSYEARVNKIRDDIVGMVTNHLIGNPNIQQL